MSTTRSSEIRSRAGRTRARCAQGLCVFVLSVISACQSLTYEPDVTLGLSPERIPLRVEARNLEDASPSDDRSGALGGTSATEADTMVGELSGVVTEALIENFRNDEVFDEIRRKPESPDLIMSGTVRRFYAKSRINALGWVTSIYSPLWFLGIPIYSSFGAVDLELTFARPNGERVASYTSALDFYEWSSIYRSPQLGIGTRLNRSFSEVVREIRAQMLRDKDLLIGSRQLTIQPASQPTPAPSAPEASLTPEGSIAAPASSAASGPGDE